MEAHSAGRGAAILAAALLFSVAGSGTVGADLVASAAPGPAQRASGGVGRAAVDRAVAEVTAAVAEAGRPPCGTVTVSVTPTNDGRSWSWPARCHILIDAALVETGGKRFRYVVRHEVAHLLRGVDHYDPGFRALETRLAANVGYELVYRPGHEYPMLVDLLPRRG